MEKAARFCAMNGSMMKRRIRQVHLFFLYAFLFIILCAFWPRMAPGEDALKITVFAAASTTNAVTDITEVFKQSYPADVRLSFASSSTLAKQIANGAPADIFLSANPKWMDYLSEKDAIVAGTRSDLLGNRIVLIAPKEAGLKPVTIDGTLDFQGLLGEGRLAMGDPNHVPAGMYGKKAMEKLGLWPAVKDRLAPAKDVRAALVLVERGETPLGQVYATDAAISAKVAVVGTFPEDSHPSIIYPVAMVRRTDAAAAFMVFLKSEKAGVIFERYGFSVR